jgi:catecholate siderophore receptor
MPTLRLFTITALLLATTITTTQAEAKKTPTPEKVTQLPQITVTTDSHSNFSEGAVDGYKAGATRSGTRTDTRLLDVPQSISIVTQDQILDQNISSIGEAIRYVPGIATHQGESNRDQVTIRGNSSNADFFIDGARDDAQYFRDLYNVDRVEVLKGPNAMAFGRGGSGGLVNRVSKIADGEKTRQIVASGGSFDNKRAQADIGDKVNENFSLRLNTMYEKSGTFRQHGDLARYGFNPTAKLILGDDTDLKIGYEHFHDSRFNDRGIPSFNGAAYKVNPKTFFGDPTQNHSDATVRSGFAILTHDFTPKLKFRNYTRYTDNSKFYQNTYANSAVNNSGNLNLAAYNDASSRQNFINQTDLTSKFKIGTVKHTTLVGMEIAKQNSKSFRNTGYFNNSSTSATVSAGNPLSFAPITYRQGASDADNNSQVDIYAGYIQDQIDFSKSWQLTAGLRYDVFKMTFNNNRTSNDYGQKNGLMSPRLGLVYKPQDSISIYGNYSVTYLPSSGDQFSSLTSQLQALKPEHIQNYELGTKWDVNTRLNLTAAIYQLDRTNTRATDPSDSTKFVLTGASRTRGVEIGATGSVTDKWQIIGGYAFQDALITKQTTAARSGARVALVPKNMGSLWNKYDFTEKWAGAIGTIYQSDQFASVDETVKLKGFTRFDFATYYKINSDYRLQLNAENLFGRQYIATAHGNNNIQPGSPRAVKLLLVAKF